MPRLSGKTAMVTGGSRGIGAGIVRKLAHEGANVGFTYRSRADAAQAVADELRNIGRKSVAIEADSGNPAALTAAVDRAAGALGRIDIYVSSAGMLLFKPIEELTLEDFERIVAVDLRAAFVGSKAALRHMRKGGRIISSPAISPTMPRFRRRPAMPWSSQGSTD